MRRRTKRRDNNTHRNVTIERERERETFDLFCVSTSKDDDFIAYSSLLLLPPPPFIKGLPRDDLLLMKMCGALLIPDEEQQ